MRVIKWKRLQAVSLGFYVDFRRIGFDLTGFWETCQIIVRILSTRRTTA